jgi:nucleotide-binding universal stress UspA family protein
MVEGMNPTHPSREDPAGEPRPIVCAVDDDALAVRVLQTAAELAQRFDAPLRVVHSPYHDTFLTGEPYRSTIEAGRAFAERVSDGIAVDEYIVEIGPPEQLIVDVADEDAAMIVIGNRGRSRLEAALRGSVSHAVIANARCPVVAVSATSAPVIPPRTRRPATVEG